MKIVHVALRFDAPGGVETVVRELARRLRAAGEEVEVFASDLYDEASWDRRSGYPAVVDGVPVRRFPIRRRLVPILNMPMMIGLIDALADSGADVIHAHSHRYGHVLQAAAVAGHLDIPFVVSTHYHPADRRETALRRGFLRLQDLGFGASAYRTARAIIEPTPRGARRVAEFAPSSKIRVIPWGVELAAWSRPEGDRTGRTDVPREYFLFAGRIASNKGLDLLVEALSLLSPAQRRPLVLMGRDWGEQARLEQRARILGIGDEVRFLGHVVAPSEYRAIVRGALALVLPSEWEAFGVVLLEAMAAGTPVVATAVGGVPDVLGDGRFGRLVPYGSPEALAHALGEVVADPVRTRQLALAGRESAEGLDWSVSAERHRQLYREVARG